MPTPQTWASSLLRALGIHQTPGAIQALVGWQRAEGGHWNNQARYNPLNTTQPMPGAGNTGSQGNIKVYRNWNQGLDATVKTLRNGRYGGILSALASGSPGAVASAIGQSPWGTSGGLARSAILGTPRVAGVHPFGGASGGGAPVGGPVSVQVPQAGSSFDPGPQSLSTLAGLIGQQAPPPIQVPQAPHAVIQSPVVNAQPTDSGIGGLLDAIRTPSQELPATQQGSTKVTVKGPTATAASVGSGRSPVAGTGKIIGTPYTGTHTLGNWQSDRAVDIAVPKGTPMVALQDGQVVKVTKHPQGSGRFAGDQITIRGANGNEYFYAHGVAAVQSGQRVRKGQQLGVTGSANGVEHLHFAQMKGDPFMHVGGRR